LVGSKGPSGSINSIVDGSVLAEHAYKNEFRLQWRKYGMMLGSTSNMRLCDCALFHTIMRGNIRT